MQDKTLPLISIITVTYNAAAVLPDTLNNVFNQDYKNFEYIIIDGGSTDGTVNILKSFEHQITYWKSEKDNGIYDAMNKAIKHAKGDWLYFLGAGDILHNVLHQLAPHFNNENTVYYGDVYRHDLKTAYGGKFGPFKLAVINICHQAIFYPRRAFSKYQYEEKYRVFADHILNMYLYGDKQFTFKYLPIVISDYEGNGFSVKTVDPKYVEDKLKVIKRNFSPVVYIYTYLRRKIADAIKRR